MTVPVPAPFGMLVRIHRFVRNCAWFASLAASVAGAGSSGELFIRDVLPLDAEQRARLAAWVRDDEEAAALFERKAAEAPRLLAGTPRPLAVIHFEGLVSTDPRRIRTVEHLRDM